MRFWIAKTAMRLAMWLEPEVVRNAMGATFLEQMRREGIVGLEFGFTEDGDPAMMVRRVSDLPIVTKH
jgi:hypothetical protein